MTSREVNNRDYSALGVTKIVGVMGSGMIGSNPYEENAWSGSSRYFFRECDRRGFLHRAFGVEVENAYKVPLMVHNFSFNRDRWRQKFYLDTRYYDLLSNRIAELLSSEDLRWPVLQIGGIYNLKPIIRSQMPVYSYHDGNLAQAIRSPYFARGIRKSHLQKALDYEKNVYGNLDMIFTMSEYLRDSFINDFQIEAGRVKAIGAGVNLDAIPMVSRKDYEKKEIVFVGVDFNRKGGMDVLRAFKSAREIYPDARLNVIGPKKLAIPSGYASGVVHHGFLSKKEPAQKQKFERIMNDSVLFVLPSLYEPFGIAALEAMLYQMPCILTNAWAFPEMVKPGVNGELVKPGDEKELAEKIISLLKYPEKLQEMGTAGRELVLSKYTWRHVVSNLIESIPISVTATKG